MAIHPPMLYLGYVGFSVPFAFAMRFADHASAGRCLDLHDAALDAGHLAVPSTGVMLGAAWAYHVLGWGGYWGWDPVENASCSRG
jgi:cytochrome c-type biogenesis protein CcmF